MVSFVVGLFSCLTVLMFAGFLSWDLILLYYSRLPIYNTPFQTLKIIANSQMARKSTLPPSLSIPLIPARLHQTSHTRRNR